MSPRYRSYDDFTREHIRPELRAGWTLDAITDPIPQQDDLDIDPFEAALQAAEYEDEHEVDD